MFCFTFIQILSETKATVHQSITGPTQYYVLFLM